MATRTLSIVVYEDSDDPQNKCHWAMIFHGPRADRSNLFQVLVLDLVGLWYQFDRRDDVPLLDPNSEGRIEGTSFTASQYVQAAYIITEVLAPRNGRDRCQDWIMACVIALKAEELVPPGTSQWADELIGKSAARLAQSVGRRWTPTPR